MAKLDVPSDEIDKLRALLEMSRGVRRETPADDPKRQAGDDLCKLAKKLMDEYGVSPDTLSLDLEISGDALRHRLSARGYIRRPASIKPYVGAGPTPGSAPGPSKQEFCKRGHAMTGDNVKVKSDGKRNCRACSIARSRAWRAGQS